METVVEPRSRRGRKRKINNVQTAMEEETGGRKKVMQTRSFELVGRYVQKKFKGSRILLGRIVNHDSGLYSINYEDGRCEDLIRSKVKSLLVEDGDLSDEWHKRKEMLNDFLSSKDVNLQYTLEQRKANLIDSSSLSGLTNSSSAGDGMVRVRNDGGSDEVAADCSSASCKDVRGEEAKLVVVAPPPELPPSSGHIGIPEEYVPHLLSVYSFLRSFSVRLFLYPFVLDDFVGALNSSVANTLLDSVHVAMLSFLKRQIEKIHSDDNEIASKVLRCLDWSLLDTLTWPIYLVHYLMAMSYKNGDDWKELYVHCLERDYYTLPVGKKLTILEILCDNVLDTDELRAEMDMREASEVGMAIDTSTVLDTCKPARVKSEDCKTSDCKDIEAAQGVEKHQTKYSLDNHHLQSQAGRAIEDGNGDECRLCGMDGVLVCCDGCPLAYHSRCIGLSKMPNGSWHCPECKVNENEPKILPNSTLRGGDVFGVDPYEQVFIASCDHLLVVKTSVKSESCPRYYSRHHILGVLNALYANPECAIAYEEICRGIMQYWKLSADILSTNNKSKIGLRLADNEGSSLCNTRLVNVLDEVPETPEVDNHGTCAAETSAETAGSCLENSVQQPVVSDNSFDTATKSGYHADSARQQCQILKTTTGEPAASCGLNGQPTNPCSSSQQSNSNMTEAVSTRSSNISSVSDTSLEPGGSLVSQELNNTVGNTCRRPSSWSLYKGSSFSRTGYMNHYLHGDFSASAAANLAIHSHEEIQVSESHSSNNFHQVSCSSIADQVKAFSSAAVRFFWPNVEKKLAEVPRERCSWCFSCKAPVTSKRACLLNAAASNATRGVMKVIPGVQPVTDNGDERLSGITSYIMFMEESLSGLLGGPFLNDCFRKQWRRQLEQAVTCTEIKILLLELEENILSIAFSRDWMKLVEGFSTQLSTSQTTTGSNKKCRPGRRGKKQPNMVEVVADGFLDKLTKFTWWRGGIMSKLMFQRGVLPSSIIKIFARQGGKKKIPGVRYVEGNEIPRISRQLVWRSAVEISRTVAHLALQVRYLDLHVRWGDLGRPEQMPSDGKSSEAEASTFRNALLCGKKIVEHEVRYCVSFGSRKHLPSRVMKNIAQIEQIMESGKEGYWFSETFIPLYLIREYEQNVEKSKSLSVLSKLQRRQLKASRENIFSVLLSELGNMVRNCCSCHQDVFYRNAVKCHACQGFCHQQCATTSTVNMSEGLDFLVICKQCCETQAATQVESSNESPTIPLVPQGPDIPIRATTKDAYSICYKGSSTSYGTQVESSNESPTIPLVPQGPDIPIPATTKDAYSICYKGSSTSYGTSEHVSKLKSIKNSAATKKNSRLNWGLKWRKNNCEDTGIDFRLRNILLSGNTDRVFMKPVCRLCDQPYNAGLMYIRCEQCKNWFHADAVELDESKVFSLVGFKCCKCRRIKSPVCPYLIPNINNEFKDKKKHLQASKLEIYGKSFNCGTIPAHHEDVPTASKLSSNPEVIRVSAPAPATATNPFLASLHEAKQCNEGRSEGNSVCKNANVCDMGTRKLPVRRHATRELDLHCPATAQFEVSSPSEANAVNSAQEMPMRTSTRKETIMATNLAKANPVVSMQGLLPSLVRRLACDDLFDPESNAGGHVNSKRPQESVTEDLKISSSVSHDQEKLIRSEETSKQIVTCKFCTKSEPLPDLCCQICGLKIHKICSCWYETMSHEDGWRCGSCRDWS